MLEDSPNIGAGDITLENDPRVLPFGKFLRKAKLNEFPQFVNVFLGDMSVVGPRPLVKNQFDMIPDELKEKAVKAIDRVLSKDSELNELWSESEEDYQSWLNDVKQLKLQIENCS